MRTTPHKTENFFGITDEESFFKYIQNDRGCNIAHMALSDSAIENFSSWEEYMHSLIYGCGLYMFSIDNFNVSSAIEFICTMIPLLLNSDLADLKWKKG